MCLYGIEWFVRGCCEWGLVVFSLLVKRCAGLLWTVCTAGRSCTVGVLNAFKLSLLSIDWIELHKSTRFMRHDVTLVDLHAVIKEQVSRLQFMCESLCDKDR